MVVNFKVHVIEEVRDIFDPEMVETSNDSKNKTDDMVISESEDSSEGGSDLEDDESNNENDGGKEIQSEDDGGRRKEEDQESRWSGGSRICETTNEKVTLPKGTNSYEMKFQNKGVCVWVGVGAEVNKVMGQVNSNGPQVKLRYNLAQNEVNVDGLKECNGEFSLNEAVDENKSVKSKRNFRRGKKVSTNNYDGMG